MRINVRPKFIANPKADTWACHNAVHAMQSTPVLLLHMNVSLTPLVPDYAINNKLTPFISMQNHHNLVYREEEREMFPTLKVRPSSLTHTLRIITFCSYSALDQSLGRLSPVVYSRVPWETLRHVEKLTGSSRVTPALEQPTSCNGASTLPQ